VVNVDGETGPMLMGIAVDGVSEVLTMTGADIEDTPDFGNGVTTPLLLGVAKIKDKVKILLDIDKVITSREIQGLESVLG
jgi:purine-binding chemotaxis protein CheW